MEVRAEQANEALLTKAYDTNHDGTLSEAEMTLATRHDTNIIEVSGHLLLSHSLRAADVKHDLGTSRN